MNDTIRASFLEAGWGVTGMGWTVGRITLNSADYSVKSYDYDNVSLALSTASKLCLRSTCDAVLPPLRTPYAPRAKVTDDFDLVHFDKNLTYEKVHVMVGTALRVTSLSQ